MARVRRLVLDVLTPHEPSIVEVTRRVADAEAVEAAEATLVELDDEVRTIRLSVVGEALDPAAVEDAVAGLGGAVHSVDRVVCGDRTAVDGTVP
jgi:hypothetical protein